MQNIIVLIAKHKDMQQNNVGNYTKKPITDYLAGDVVSVLVINQYNINK